MNTRVQSGERAALLRGVGRSPADWHRGSRTSLSSFLFLSYPPKGLKPFILQISAMDLSAQTTMKSTANCDKHCELQNSEKHQTLERALHSRDIPESKSASESDPYSDFEIVCPSWQPRRACLCAIVAVGA